MEGSRQFGTPDPLITYRERAGAYGVAYRNGMVLIEKAPLGYFLPGGGIDLGESPEDALRREFMEETGFEITANFKIGVATEYSKKKNQHGNYLKKIGHFYKVDLGKKGEPTKPDGSDHHIEWIPLPEIQEHIFLDSYWWAIEQIVNGLS